MTLPDAVLIVIGYLTGAVWMAIAIEAYERWRDKRPPRS